MNHHQTQAVIYDFDGTIIDTEQLHANGWRHVGVRYGFEVTPEAIVQQRGLSGDKALRLMIPADRVDLLSKAKIDEMREVKSGYVLEHAGSCPILPGFTEAYDALRAQALLVGVCTSSRADFIDAVLQQRTELSGLRGSIVSKGMFSKGKPDAEPLLKTLEHLGGIASANAVYVGDAYSDYMCAINAHVHYVHFDAGTPDPRIPTEVVRIRDHRDLLTIIGRD
ncbi:HAD hydrolase-like protein [Candidatus Woesearchaeota archaeon]|nr:HAD hydrolase-like protein [Candidatus Woesearchaeota archaeon]